jgi:short-subunit dehydrogenase
MTAQPELIALITGASSGIGEEFARQLAEKGYSLILTARRTALLESLAQEIRTQYAVEVEILTADLSTLEGIDRVENRIRQLQHLDLLINNAGFGVRGYFYKADMDQLTAMAQVHMTAPLRLTRAALERMFPAKKGTIIQVSSPASLLPFMGNAVYSATKAFLNIFTESIRRELLGTKIHLQVLLPGFTYSGFHKTSEYKEQDLYNRIPHFLWMDSGSVVKKSLQDLEKRSLYCVPGFTNQLIVFFARTGVIALLGDIGLSLIPKIIKKNLPINPE